MNPLEKVAAACDELQAVLREHNIACAPINIYTRDESNVHIGLVLSAEERVRFGALIPLTVNDVPVKIYGVAGISIPFSPDKLDGKFYGTVFRDSNDELIGNDRWVAFMAYDLCFLPTLFFYKSECQRRGAPAAQIEAVSALIARVQAWQRSHPGELRVPGTVHSPTPQQLSRSPVEALTLITTTEQEVPLPRKFWHWLDANRPECLPELRGLAVAMVRCCPETGRVCVRFPSVKVRVGARVTRPAMGVLGVSGFDRQTQPVEGSCIVTDHPEELGFKCAAAT